MTNGLDTEDCGDVDGRRHLFATDRQAPWIPNEGSYQLWGVCKNEGCMRSAWFVLTEAPVISGSESKATT